MQKQKTWKILITKEAPGFKIDKIKVKRIIREALADLDDIDLPCSVSELSLLFTDNSTIHALNRDFRAKDKPTDVLSFSQLEGEFGASSQTLGDIVISLEYAKVQARKYKATFAEEILRLLIHGILHLHGFDHEHVPASERQRMKRREKKIFEALKPLAKGLIHG